MTNKAFATVTIPDKHYAGYQWREGGVLGFITPYGEDAAGLKRMETVNGWRDKKDGSLMPDILENKPMPGFRLVKNVTRYETSNVVWRVMDSRGFELEISSANLSMLLQSCEIKNGIIQTECIWGRGGGKNVLVSVESEVYRDAVELTGLKLKKVALRDVKIGSTVVLQNRTKGEYFGKVSFCLNRGATYSPNGDVTSPYNTAANRVVWSKTSTTEEAYVMRIYNDPLEVENGKDAYYYEHMSSAPKIAEVTTPPPSEYTPVEVVHMLNNDHQLGYVTGLYRSQCKASHNYFYHLKKSAVVAEIVDMAPEVRDVRLGRLSSPYRYGYFELSGLKINSIEDEPLLYKGDNGEWRAMIFQTGSFLYSVAVNLFDGEGRVEIVVPDCMALAGHNTGSWYSRSYGNANLKTEDEWYALQKKYFTSMERHHIIEYSLTKYQTIGFRDNGEA